MNQVPLPPTMSEPPENRGSYVVQFHIHEARLVKTHFAPGYTNMHRATPEEALEAARIATQRIIDQHLALLRYIDEIDVDPDKIQTKSTQWKTTPPRSSRVGRRK